MTTLKRRRELMREREVLKEVRECNGVVSVWWLENPLTRGKALERLEKRGRVKVTVMGYPNYKIVEVRK